MRILPSNSQEWFTALLRPFEVYTFLGIFIFQVLLACRRQPGIREMAELALGLYIISVPVLLLGGLVQLGFTPRRAAKVAFLFAAIDVCIIIFHIRYFVG